MPTPARKLDPPIGARLETGDLQRLNELAQRESKPKTALIRLAVKEYLERNAKPLVGA